SCGYRMARYAPFRPSAGRDQKVGADGFLPFPDLPSRGARASIAVIQPESQPMDYLPSGARVTCHATTFQFPFCLTQITVLRRSIGLNGCPLSDPLKVSR